MTTSRDRMSLGVLMLLIAGAALGFWLALDVLKTRGQPNGPVEDWTTAWVFAFVFILGGLSLVGHALLLLTARMRGWGAGRFLWFVEGTASWLLWPRAIYHRITVPGDQHPM